MDGLTGIADQCPPGIAAHRAGIRIRGRATDRVRTSPRFSEQRHQRHPLNPSPSWRVQAESLLHRPGCLVLEDRYSGCVHSLRAPWPGGGGASSDKPNSTPPRRSGRGRFRSKTSFATDRKVGQCWHLISLGRRHCPIATISPSLSFVPFVLM